MLRIEGFAKHFRCSCVDEPSRSPEQFRTLGPLQPTAVQRCACTCIAIKSRRREPRRDGSIHLGCCVLRALLNIPVVHKYIDLHALLMNKSKTTRRAENDFEKRRLSASACLFPLESGVALSKLPTSSPAASRPGQDQAVRK